MLYVMFILFIGFTGCRPFCMHAVPRSTLASGIFFREFFLPVPLFLEELVVSY